LKKRYLKKHFVTFLSPGTFVSETTTKPIEKWDSRLAKSMVGGITERHGATPYGFYFSTRERKAADLDSKETKTSGIYYLGGKVETLAQVKARVKREHSEEESDTLIWNMETNKIKRIVTNTNSYRFTAELRPGDKVLTFTPKKKLIFTPKGEK
jgi:hypothetical protein